jgi:hypothetical protein
MKRADITPEELNGLLVAFADNQLDQTQSSEIRELISEHPDLADKVEHFKMTGGLLADFLDPKELQAPPHIVDKINLIASKQDSLVATAEQNILGIKNEKIVSFSAFKKLKNKLSLTPQSLTQMVAACALGLVMGPSLFNNTQLGNDSNKMPLNFRGAGKLVPVSSPSLEHAILLMSQSLDGKFNDPIRSGDFIKLGTPFVINITSPIDGKVRVYEEVSDTRSGVLGAITKNQIFDSNVSKGISIKLPESGAFSLSDQEKFILITEFFNDYENQRIRQEYKLK